jgi:hypothetical protein
MRAKRMRFCLQLPAFLLAACAGNPAGSMGNIQSRSSPKAAVDTNVARDAIEAEKIGLYAITQNHECSVDQAGDLNCRDPCGKEVFTGHLLAPTELSVGLSFDCAVQRDGLVRCWKPREHGDTYHGVSVQARKVAVGAAHACAIGTDTSLVCWGRNRHGELGRSPSPGLELAETTVARGVVSVAAGIGFTCIVTDDGSVQCSGSNTLGQLGRFGVDSEAQFTTVPGVSGATEVFGGLGGTVCARLADGGLMCWGDDRWGQFGDGKGVSAPSLPTTIVGVPRVRSLAVSIAHLCAITEDRSVSCWGWNGHGQVTGTPSPQVVKPTLVPGITGAKAISLKGTLSCALLESGRVCCWGEDDACTRRGGANVFESYP